MHATGHREHSDVGGLEVERRPALECDPRAAARTAGFIMKILRFQLVVL